MTLRILAREIGWIEHLFTDKEKTMWKVEISVFNDGDLKLYLIHSIGDVN